MYILIIQIHLNDIKIPKISNLAWAKMKLFAVNLHISSFIIPGIFYLLIKTFCTNFKNIPSKVLIN